MRPAIRIARSLVLALACLTAPVTLAAAPISGVLTATGDISVGLATIDFLPPAGGDSGAFTVGPAAQQTGAFVALGGTAGTVKDLNTALVPVGVPVFFTDFMLFVADPNIEFQLTMIFPGVFGLLECLELPAAGQTCTPFVNSPFNMTNLTAQSSELSFSVLGWALNVATGEVSNYIGTFTAQFPNDPFQDLLAVELSGGSVTASYEASFQAGATAVPEPPVLALLCAGLSALGLLRRARARMGPTVRRSHARRRPR